MTKLPSPAQLLAMARAKGYGGGMKKTSSYAGRRNLRRRRGRKPARFDVSRSVYRKNKRVSSMMSRMSETKLIPTIPFNETAPKTIQTGAIAYYAPFIMCNVPAGWDTNFNNLAGIQTAQGLGGSGNRVGDYIYLKKTHVNFQIDINETNAYQPPVEFRMIVAKAKMAVLPAGFTYTPSTTLFLNQVGFPVGHTTSGINGMDLMLQPLNKRDFVIHTDKKFTLSSPSTGGAGMNYYYPSRKNCIVNLPYYSKTRISTSTNLPEDLDTHYFVIFYASAIGKDRPASNWEVSVRGTTSYTDN